MGVFDSVISWLEDLFKPLKELYDKDSSAFFLGAILVILILLIIVIILARRAENSEDKPAKKVKYEDIDWSFHDENSEPVRKETAQQTVQMAPVQKPETEKYGLNNVDINKNTFGREGLSPEVAEALINSIRRQSEGIDVPDWMAKQTLSIDDIESLDAQEWLEQELREKEAKAHDVEVQKATVARIAHILERVEACDQFHEAEKSKACEEAVTQALGEKHQKDNEVKAEEPVKVPAEPVSVPESYESDTLSKILKEAENIREEEETENLLDHIEKGTAYEEEDNEVPQWDIASTLAKLEAENAENDRLLRELEGGAFESGEEPGIMPEITFRDLDLSNSPFTSQNEPEKPAENDSGEDKLAKIDSLINEPKGYSERDTHESPAAYEEPVSEEAPSPEPEKIPEPAAPEYRPEEISESDPDRIQPSFFGTLRKPVRRFGINNRDTNRSGRKFTEEELIKQIRD